MVKVSYLGGLGNNLWQYSAGRLLAERESMAFEAPIIADLPGLETSVSGKKYYLHKKVIAGHYIPQDCSRSRIIIKSGLERYENIAGNQSKIKAWIKIPVRETPFLNKNDLVISIRRGWNNYPADENCPPIEFYAALLEKFEYERLYICTDSPEDVYFDGFKKLVRRYEFFKGDRITQLNLLLKAPRLIMAPSTFSFWGGYLGNSEKVYWPRIPALNFLGKNHDWFPYDDKRHEWIM